MKRDRNPLDLIGHQVSSIESKMQDVNVLSRGQKKRLDKKVNTFQGKKFLLEKANKMKQELKNESRKKQKDLQQKKLLNEGFMEVDASKKQASLPKFDSMDQALNQISKQQNQQKMEAKKQNK